MRKSLMVFRLPGGASFPLRVVPPERVGEYWEVLNVVGKSETTYAILSKGVVSLYCHYVGDRTIPCMAEITNSCDYCSKRERKFQAYVAVTHKHNPSKTCILPLTNMAVQRDPWLKSGEDILAGRTITVRRRTDSKRSQMIARVSSEVLCDLPEDRVIDPSQLLAQVLWIWGVRFEEQGV